MNTERNLLAGILALQLNFIDRRQLLAAFDRWISDKSKALTGILESLGQLTTERRVLLEALVDEHLKLHGGDPQKSLAELTPIGPLREELAALADRDLEASLAHLSVSRGFDASPIGIQDLFRQARVREPASPSDDDPFRTAPRSAVESTTDLPRFRVLRPHARGGLGEVYVARDEELHRDVALKEIQARHAANPASRQRFVLEAEITGGLEHPGIVPVYGLGSYADGRPFYAMRFIKGDNLKTAIEKFHGNKASGGREPPVQSTATDGDFTSLEFRKLLGRFIDVCNAIEYAHSRGVLHRDLKPGNIMLGKYGETLVVDWGLAKVVGRAEVGDSTAETTLRPQSAGDSAPTEMGSVVGTPHYMSPEQAEGRLDELGPASDVYSLGATLYTVLTGRPAFTGAQELEVLRCVVKGEFQSPRQVNRGVPRPLEAVCLKAMALKSAERYPSPRALADDVEHWLADEPVTALRETAGERLGRWGRKHRSWVRAGVAAALVVAAVSAAALVVVDRARRAESAQRRVAETRETQAIDAVKRFRDAVANEPELKNSPRLELLRQRLLKEPLAFFKELRERLQADNDTRPESLARLAQACFDLGLLTDAIGDKQDALAAYRECLAIHQKLAEDNPTVTQYQSHLAASHNNMGNLLSATGNPGDALLAHEAALAMLQKLADNNPTVTEFQSHLAASHNNIGVLLSDTGKPAEALAAYQSALAIRQKLADDNPTVTDFQSDLALSHNNMGSLLSETGKPAAALAAHKLGLAIQQKLADDNPTVTDFHRDLALSHNNIGLLLKNTGKPAQALAAYESALAIRQKLADDNPTVTEYRLDLAASHHNIGVLLIETGKPDEALAAYESALAIREKLADDNPTVTKYRRDLALSHDNIGILLSETGRPAEALAAHKLALAIRQRLADDNPTVTDLQRDLALGHENVGLLLKNAGKPAEALAAYQSALAIRQKLADDNPTVTEFQSHLAASHNNIGNLLRSTGKPAEALAAHESALAIRRKLADDNPTVTEYQSHLAVSHNNIGVLLKETGKPAEALAAYESALAIRQKLAGVNTTVTQFQSELAVSHNNIGALLTETGKRAEALAAYQSALAIRQKLADDNPTVTELQSHLAVCYNNIAFLLNDTGKRAEALATYESALAIGQKLADDNPTVAEYRRDLAVSHNNTGILLINTGKPAEALTAFESALAIRQKLANDSPAVTRYQSELAAGHNNIGLLLSNTGKLTEALAAYQSALAIQQKLALEYSESPDLAIDLGGTLNNLALLDLNAKRFEEARARLREAVKWQRKALASNPANPIYRRFLAIDLTNLIVASRGLSDAEGVAEAERELTELRDSDPAFSALDARLAAIAKGEHQPASEAERLALAQRAYDKALHATAARLWVETLDANPALADNRQTQHRYNAACCAALAAAGRGRDVPPPDDAAKAKLRQHALGWLKAELDSWSQFLENATPELRQAVAQTLKHWQADADLAVIRDAAELTKLPEAERGEFDALWRRVEDLVAQASAEPTANEQP